MNWLPMRPLLMRLKNIAVKSLVITCTFLLSCFICACNNTNDSAIYSSIYSGGDFTDDFQVYEGFSVNFLDVGEGDAVFINFAEGKTMLIDCGEKSEVNLKTLIRYIDAYTEGDLDYLILTHPDSDHVGNAADILSKYTVKTVYIPKLLQPQNFEAYNKALVIINEKEAADETEVVYSTVNSVICGEDYYAVFLSPDKWDNPKGSAYDDINSSEYPSPDARNNVSPIIYLDYKGVRFIFTGDAGFSQEKVALNNADAGLINKILKKKGKGPLNLTDIDFLKVSHHGGDDASGAEFLQRITSKNAIISVGGDNKYGHPKQAVLSRIYSANENCKVYMTSEDGTVSVLVNENGEVTVKTAKAA